MSFRIQWERSFVYSPFWGSRDAPANLSGAAARLTEALRKIQPDSGRPHTAFQKLQLMIQPVSGVQGTARFWSALACFWQFQVPTIHWLGTNEFKRPVWAQTSLQLPPSLPFCVSEHRQTHIRWFPLYWTGQFSSPLLYLYIQTNHRNSVGSAREPLSMHFLWTTGFYFTPLSGCPSTVQLSVRKS